MMLYKNKSSVKGKNENYLRKSSKLKLKEKYLGLFGVTTIKRLHT